MYLFLSLTWGLPLTALGVLIFAVLMLFGFRPKRFGYCLYIEIGQNWGGLELGPFFLKDRTPSLALMAHEHGHGFQNILWGPLMLPVITIPSSIRYWVRNLKTALGKGASLPPYGAIWFEASADRLGMAFWREENQRKAEKERLSGRNQKEGETENE